MLRQITYYLIFGKPLILYLGILALLALLFTAIIGYLNLKGNQKIPFKWHLVAARVAIMLALAHALLGILTYF